MTRVAVAALLLGILPACPRQRALRSEETVAPTPLSEQIDRVLTLQGTARDATAQ